MSLVTQPRSSSVNHRFEPFPRGHKAPNISRTWTHEHEAIVTRLNSDVVGITYFHRFQSSEV